MQNEQEKETTKILFVAGDRSGVGKSSICLGLLGAFLSQGFPPNSLAYIKPCTQCQDVQIVSKFCEKHGIAHRGIGPIIFYQGFTAECIDEENPQKGVHERQQKIKNAVQEISVGKKIVLVDGVGYPAVGSVSGISNAEIARLLGAPVLLIGRPGLGNAIDSFNLNKDYFEHHGVTVLGGIWNNIPESESYHTYDSCKEYVAKYYRKFFPKLGIYGHVRRNEGQWIFKLEHEEVQACILRETKLGLQFKEGEENLCEEIVAWQKKFVDGEALVGDLKKFYEKR